MHYEENIVRVYASVVDTTGKKQTFALSGKPILIGRSSNAHITITDDLTSGTHCLIEFVDGCVFVEDMKSKNGIFLNEIKILKQRVYIDDKVRIGKTYLYLEPKKMDTEAIKALTPSGSTNRSEGELTLELETFKENKKQNHVKSSLDGNKLFAGVNENKKKLTKTVPSGFKLTIIEKLSFIIDITLSLILIVLPFIIFKSILPKREVSISTLTSGSGLHLLITTLVVSFAFFKWNRAGKKGSIGERFCGID